MKKRYVLKKWVKNLLIIVECMLIMLLCMDFNNLLLFITSKAVIMIIIYAIGKILIKHTDIMR